MPAVRHRAIERNEKEIILDDSASPLHIMPQLMRGAHIVPAASAAPRGLIERAHAFETQ